MDIRRFSALGCRSARSQFLPSSLRVLQTIYQPYELSDVNRQYGTSGRNRQGVALRSRKGDMAGASLPIFDAKPIRYHLQILDFPVARVVPHPLKSLGCAWDDLTIRH